MRNLAERLRSGRPLLGTLLRMPNEVLVEMTALAGMDFVVIDAEHGPADQIPLAHHLMAAAAVGIPALVRVGNLSEILRVLDLGAAGIIAPHISTVDQAEAVVRAASYPPRGDRGFATYTRSGRHGLIGTAEHLRDTAAGTVIILMIEDGPGVAAAQQIAETEGVDGLFVGPADLSVALGFPGDAGGAEVSAAIADVHSAARRAGVAVVTITGEPRTAQQQIAAGSTMVIYNVLAALGGLFTSMANARGAVEVGPADRSTVADPVVFLPGMFLTPQMWEDVISDLDPGLAVIGARIDLDDTVAGMADSVLAQAPERFSLVGHSLGGIVALEITRRAPHRVSRLALVNCSGRGPSTEQGTAWSALADRTRAGEFDTVVDEQADINLGPAAPRPDLLESWRQGAHQVGVDGLLRQLTAQATRPNSLPSLSAIAVPTLVVGGELDAVAPPTLQRELADGISGAEYLILPGAGHMTPMDCAPALARALTAFLIG